MNQQLNFVGIDIAAEDFTVSLFKSPQQSLLTQEAIPNSVEGFNQLLAWLSENKLNPSNTLLCLEATGIYGEALCYFLASQNYQLAVEPPAKVKRAFDISGHKTDAVDSRQIAEYAYRYHDELKLWKPREFVLEQIRQLLTAREQFTKQNTALRNSLRVFERSVVQTPLVQKTHQLVLEQLKKNILDIDREIQRLLDQNPTFKQINTILKTTPGVGLLLASNFLVLTQGYKDLGSRRLSAYIGICPYKKESGKSLSANPRCRYFGPPITRKLLHLAARSVSTHNPYFKKYYLRKIAEGKAKRLVLNNIANKLVKIMCALVRDTSSFIPNYKSINPLLLNIA